MKISKALYEELTHMSRAKLNSEGSEVNNPKPMAVHTGLNKPLSMQEQIQRLLRISLSQQAGEQGFETWREANDFDVVSEFEHEHDDTGYVLLEDEQIPVVPEPEPEPAQPDPAPPAPVEPEAPAGE